MRYRFRLTALATVAVLSFLPASVAVADPGGPGALPPFRVTCTSGGPFMVSFGDIHNRSTQGFVADGTGILVARTLSIDGTVVFSRAVNANAGDSTVCTGTDAVGEVIVITGFVTPRT